MRKISLKLAGFVFLLLATSSAWGVNIEFVPVGNPGNEADEAHYGDPIRHGKVDYNYGIGKYDVTAGQYCDFLNAVARTSDLYGLYNPNMAVPTMTTWGCNIIREGDTGSYSYRVDSDWANRPVNYVSWGDAVRFCNWLENGQPTIGEENDLTTEAGSYSLHGALSNDDLMKVKRGDNARYVLPTLDEWYKAAYYDPNKPGGPGCWRFPTKSDSLPSNVLDEAGKNNANFYDFDKTGTGKEFTIGEPYFRTEVGAFVSSPSAYGTFDQGGNVENWNETARTADSRSVCGGEFSAAGAHLSKEAGTATYATVESFAGGFRVANLEVPEPEISSMLISALAISAFYGMFQRKRYWSKREV